MSDINELKRKLEEAENNSDALRDLNTNLLNKLKEKNDEMKKLADGFYVTNMKSSEQIQDLLNADKAKQLVIDSLRESIMSNQQKVKNFEKSIEAYRLGNETLQADISEIEKENDRLEDELNYKEAQLLNSNKKILKLEAKNAKLKEDNKNLDTSIKEQMKHYETILRKFFKNVNNLKPLLSNMSEEEIDKLKEYYYSKIKF